MKKSIFSKLKKALVVMIVMITMFIAMPVKSNANVINDFVNLLLYIPDGIMAIIDGKIAESNEFTSRELDFKGWDKNGHIYNFKVTPYEIFTSGCYEDKGDGNYTVKLGYLDINFFSDRPIVSETGGVVSSNILAPVIGNIYKGLRDLCMVLMLLVILYIGIKIMISSIAEQQAKYKKFLVDWVVGFALLFMMHYIMAGIVGLNTLIVQMFVNDEGDSYYIGVNELENVNGDGNANWSTWLDIVHGKASLDDVVKIGDTSFNHKWESEEEFLRKRVITIDEDNYEATYSNPAYSKSGVGVEQDGRLDLTQFENVVYNGKGGNGRVPYLKDYSGEKMKKSDYWGDDGVIYLSASIINPEPFKNFDELTQKDRAIIKMNAMSYVRTISNFSSDNDAVVLYQNGEVKEVDTWDSMGYSALYLCLVIETIMFLFVYIKRVLQMAFLTMVAPIVAIMYPVDRLGDGKAQSFNQWFKDYLFNVLIQPMHLLLYTVFIVAAGQLISRNIIYGLAIYGFMIPAENYFKKVLGFEKASNGGGGALSKAMGAGLAMEGLGKLAGIGPAARGKGGSGSGDSKRRLRKIGKNKPDDNPSSGGLGGGPAGSGAPGAGGAGGGSNGQGGSRRNGAGSGSGSGSRRPGASGTPSANGNGKRGTLSRAGSAIKRRAIKAATGGAYSNLKSSDAKLVAGANAGRFLGRKIARAGGAVLGGSAGLVVGAASAMATGNTSNLSKGLLLGASGGRNFAGNKFDSATGFIADFGNDIKAEKANEQVEIMDENGRGTGEYEYTDEAKLVRKEMRAEEALKKLDDEITDLPEEEQQKYIDVIEENAQYVSFDSIKDVKGFMELQKSGITNPKELVDMYDDAKGYDVSTHRDAYMKEQLRAMAENDQYISRLDEAKREKIIKEIMDDPEVLQTTYQGWQNYYDAAAKRTKLVISAQKKMG